MQLFMLKDKKVIPCTEYEWSEQLASDERIVRQDYLKKRNSTILISTVFVGDNGGIRPFETALQIKIGHRTSPFEIVERYKTYEDAEEGHEKYLRDIRDKN